MPSSRTYYQRGRFISRKIAIDPKLNSQDDSHFLLFLMLIPHLDAEARLHGDAVILKGLCCPKRKWSAETVEEMLTILQTIKREDGLGILERYTAKGTECLWMPGFEGEQKGLQKDHEAKGKYGYSDIPPPPNRLLRMLEQGEVTKPKIISPPNKLDPRLAEAVKNYEGTFGKVITPQVYERLKDIVDNHSDDEYNKAVDEAKTHKARSPIGYIETCLENWHREAEPVQTGDNLEGFKT